METVSGNLASALRIEPGITAIIGSGGKSTLLKALGLELMRAGGRVLLCTTTHMFPVAGVPWDGSNRRLDARALGSRAPHMSLVAPARPARALRAEASVRQASWTRRQASSPPPPSHSASWHSALTTSWPRRSRSKRLRSSPRRLGAGDSLWHRQHRLDRRRLGARQAHQRSRPLPRALLRALRLRAHRHRHTRSASPRCSMPRCRRWDSAPHASCSTKSTRSTTRL